MGAVEEGGKVAASAIESLKSQPLALALIIVNALFLAFMVWLSHEISVTNRIERDYRTALFKELQTTCEAMREKLSSSQRQFRLQSDDPPDPPDAKEP